MVTTQLAWRPDKENGAVCAAQFATGRAQVYHDRSDGRYYWRVTYASGFWQAGDTATLAEAREACIKTVNQGG